MGQAFINLYDQYTHQPLSHALINMICLCSNLYVFPLLDFSGNNSKLIALGYRLSIY